VPRDYLSKTIKKGDKIVYPIRRGSDMHLRTLVVNAVMEDGVHGTNDKGRPVKITQTIRCVIVERG